MKCTDPNRSGQYNTSSSESATRNQRTTVPVVRVDGERGSPIPVKPTKETRQFDQTKVHGAKAALTFVADETRAGEPTVTIESAVRLEGGDRAYAWNDKLRFQLTPAELQLLTCVLLGTTSELSFRNHGDKWCNVRQTFETYAGNIRVTMGQGDAKEFVPRSVAIDFATVGPVTALCLRQCAQLLRVPIEVVPAIMRSVSRAYSERCGSGRAQTRSALSSTVLADRQ